MKSSPKTLLAAIAAVMLILACFHLPIGYYTFLRIAVFGIAIVLIVLNRSRGIDAANIITALLAILFNPIVPIYLHSRSTWLWIDLLAAVWFIALIFLPSRKDRDA